MEKYQDFMFQIDYRDRDKLWSRLHQSAKLYLKKTEYEWDPEKPTIKTVYLHLQYAKTVEQLRTMLPFALNIKTDVPRFTSMKRTLAKQYACDTILVKMAHSIDMQIGPEQ